MCSTPEPFIISVISVFCSLIASPSVEYVRPSAPTLAFSTSAAEGASPVGATIWFICVCKLLSAFALALASVLIALFLLVTSVAIAELIALFLAVISEFIALVLAFASALIAAFLALTSVAICEDNKLSPLILAVVSELKSVLIAASAFDLAPVSVCKLVATAAIASYKSLYSPSNLAFKFWY